MKISSAAYGTDQIMVFVRLNILLERNYAVFPCEENLEHFHKGIQLSSL